MPETVSGSSSVPALRLENLRGCGVHQDSWTHDGRLCLANVTAAAEAGATVLNYAEVVDLATVKSAVSGAEVHDRLSGEIFTVEARAVVNATGPWLDELRRFEEPGVAPYGQLSKGVHVTLPLEEPWSSALTIPHDQVRVTFAYPWEGMLLLGTTDTPYEGDPADVDGDRRRHRHGARRGRRRGERRLLRRDRVLATYAGLRVLPPSDGSTVDARRETAILVGRGGMLTVAGGKLTTYRHIALDALERLAPTLGLRRLDRRPVPAAGRDRCGQRRGAARARVAVEQAVAAHLAHFYGSRADGVVALAAERPELLERAAPRRTGHRRAGRLRRPGGVGHELGRRVPPANHARCPRPHGSGRPRMRRRAPRLRPAAIASAAARSDWIEAFRSRREAGDGNGRGTADVHPS